MLGIEQLNAVTPDSLVLSVAAGHERPLFALTNQARMVFATDIYGAGDFSSRESSATMLVNPDAFARFPYNRNRLVVQYMNALDLRYEADTFDLVFSLSSIEHFESARRALEEMHRVARPEGIVMFTTECVVNDAVPPKLPDLQLFPPRVLEMLIAGVPGLKLVEPIRYGISEQTRRVVHGFVAALDCAERGQLEFPHIVLEVNGCHFTSVSVFLRKASD
jgi:SAM-dependent methyltransferase